MPREKNTRSVCAIVPDDFLAALRKTRGALTAFEQLPPSHRREYVQWIVEAKRAETRVRRIESTIARIATRTHPARP